MRKTKILIVNAAQDSSNDYFAAPIYTLLKRSESRIIPYKNIRSIQDTTGYDAIIISGQPPDDESHTIDSATKYYGWIKQVSVPLFGFCGGHQVIAINYGGLYIKDQEAEPKGYFAAYAANDYIDDPIFAGIHFGRCNSFIVYNKHRDSVALPNEFATLASTDRCGNSFMKHRNKPIYGAQFHPEDPDYYRRAHGSNQQSNQDSDTVLVNFENIVLKSTKETS